MTFCGVCGTQLSKSDMFCPNCGAKIQHDFDSPPAKPVDSGENYTHSQSKTNPPQYQTTSSQAPYYPNTPYQQNQSYQQNQPYGGYQTNRGYNQPYNYPYDKPIDSIAWWIYVLSFFIFPIGLYYYFAHRQEKPNSTKNLIIVTIIGIVVYLM